MARPVPGSHIFLGARLSRVVSPWPKGQFCRGFTVVGAEGAAGPRLALGRDPGDTPVDN
jgi:hypothetical protein